jgi:hypothetical protein
MAKKTYQDWEFKEAHVEPDVLDKNENFVSSESIVICAGPSNIDANVDLAGSLYPIGILESAAVVQNKQIQQLFEIGSRKPYMIPGRTRVQIGLSRVIFNGDSLLAAMYYGVGSAAPGEIPVPGVLTSQDASADSPGHDSGYPTTGEGNFYLNLASSFFNKPFGLALIVHDSEDDQTAMILIQNCMVQSHQMNIGANQTIVMENVNIIADSIQPVIVSVPA